MPPVSISGEGIKSNLTHRRLRGASFSQSLGYARKHHTTN